MSTSLHLMIQLTPLHSRTKREVERTWLFKDTIDMGVCSFLNQLGVNPETDAGTVGDLIPSQLSQPEQAELLLRYIACQQEHVSHAFHKLYVNERTNSLVLAQSRFHQLLVEAYKFLVEFEVNAETGLVHPKYLVAIRWS